MQRSTTPLTHSQALVEASRCLGCFQAPCAQACPAHVDVPGFIRRFHEDNPTGAAELIYSTCPLGNICGNACPTSELCEKACVLNQLGQAPIRIGALQAHITRTVPVPSTHSPTQRNRRVAIIGAGPAGLGCAEQLARLGIETHLFDRQKEPGGMVSAVIPAHRLPQECVRHDLARLLDAGIHFHGGIEIDAIRAQSILQEYDAVFLGIGLSAEPVFDVPGMPAGGVFSALKILDQARRIDPAGAQIPGIGRRVIVVGGGNVALDAAVVAKRSGAEQVILIYRRGLDEMPGWRSEYLEACALGVEFRWFSVVEKVNSQAGKLSSASITRMRYSAETKGGRRWVEPDPDQPAYDQPCDTLMYALGQTLEAQTAAHFGLSPANQRLTVREGSCQTVHPKIFAAGEAVLGGSTIVACMSAGMAAGREIARWLEEGGANNG